MSGYNGLPSYDHWNVALWIGSTPSLYAMATHSATPAEFQTYLDEIRYTETGDGVAMTPELVAYAWASVDDDRDEGGAA